MEKTSDLVAAVTLPELQAGLDVASRLSRYLPEWISEQHPDISSLMFALWSVLSADTAPEIIVYDVVTHYFLLEKEAADPDSEELDLMLRYDICPFCGCENEGGELCSNENCAGLLLKQEKRFIKALTIHPGGRLVFHGIRMGGEE